MVGFPFHMLVFWEVCIFPTNWYFGKWYLANAISEKPTNCICSTYFFAYLHILKNGISENQEMFPPSSDVTKTTVKGKPLYFGFTLDPVTVICLTFYQCHSLLCIQEYLMGP